MRRHEKNTTFRKLRALGVAAVAALAMSASLASAAQADSFNAAKYPAAVSGISTGDVFSFFGSTVKCTENTFTSTLASASPTLSITPTFKNCKLGLFPMVWTSGTAKFAYSTTKIGSSRTMSVVGGSVKIDVYASGAAKEAGTPMCEMTIPEQGPLQGTLAYTNSGNKLILSGALNGIKITQVRKSAWCPSGTETTTASYQIQGGGISLGSTYGGVENPLYVG